MATAGEPRRAVSWRLLRDLLVRRAYEHRPDNPFLLASGKWSDEYLDCKRALSHPEALPALGQLFLAEIPSDVTAVGGLTMGADAISLAVAHVSANTDHPRRWFSVRKEPKKHGQRRFLEGDLSPGERVTVVDDVVTSGTSTIDAITKAKEFSLVVAQVLVLIDREDGGLSAIKAMLADSVDVRAFFTLSEIRATAQSGLGLHEARLEDLRAQIRSRFSREPAYLHALESVFTRLLDDGWLSHQVLQSEDYDTLSATLEPHFEALLNVPTSDAKPQIDALLRALESLGLRFLG